MDVSGPPIHGDPHEITAGLAYHAVYQYSDVDTVRKCDRCSYEGAPDTFPRKRNGSGHLRVCFSCNNKQIAKKAATSRVSLDGGDEPRENTAMEFGECMGTIAGNKEWPLKFDAFVRLAPQEMDEMWQGGADASTHARANAVREKVSAASGYHWNQKKSLRGKGSSRSTVVTYYCSQLEGENTKHRLVEDENRRRARRDKMVRYHCGGWLHITVLDDDPLLIRIRICHEEAHPPPDPDARKRTTAGQPRVRRKPPGPPHDMDGLQPPDEHEQAHAQTMGAAESLANSLFSLQGLSDPAPPPDVAGPSVQAPQSISQGPVLSLPSLRQRPQDQPVFAHPDVSYALPDGFPSSPPFSPVAEDTPYGAAPFTEQRPHQHRQHHPPPPPPVPQHPGYPNGMHDYLDPALRNAPMPPHNVLYPPDFVQRARQAFTAMLEVISDPRGLDAELASKLDPILGASVELASTLLAGAIRDDGRGGANKRPRLA